MSFAPTINGFARWRFTFAVLAFAVGVCLAVPATSFATCGDYLLHLPHGHSNMPMAHRLGRLGDIPLPGMPVTVDQSESDHQGMDVPLAGGCNGPLCRRRAPMQAPPSAPPPNYVPPESALLTIASDLPPQVRRVVFWNQPTFLPSPLADRLERPPRAA